MTFLFQETPVPNPLSALPEETTGAESAPLSPESPPVSGEPADAAPSEQGSSSAAAAAALEISPSHTNVDKGRVDPDGPLHLSPV